MNKISISLKICFALVVIPGLCVSSFAANESEAEQHFKHANELTKLADYDAAIAEFKKVISLSPKSEIAQNTQYWIGQSHFSAGRFDAALSAFQTLLDEYPSSMIIPSTKLAIERVQQAKKNGSLFEATKKGDFEQVKLLLGQGLDIDVKDNEGLTPLHHAIKEGHTELAVFLIDQGTDIEAKKKPGDWTPLLYAIDLNNADIVEALVNKGADVNYTPKRGYSPLINAIWSKDKYNMAKLLVDHGAKFDVKDYDGWTAFRRAAEAGYHDLIKLFVAKGADISTFHRAACVGHLGRVKDFVEQGTDVDTKDELGWTPLFWAVCMGRTEMTQFLITKGANVNLFVGINRYRQTALHRAARTGAKDIVQLLIAQGADVNARDINGRGPLHGAYNKEVVEFLIRGGADVNLRSWAAWGGMTPLFLAASSGHVGIVEILLANGADVTTNDNNGKSPLMVAREEGHTGVVELLRQHGAKETLHGAAASGNIDEVKRLISQGADVNEKIQGDITPLLSARDVPVVEFLVSKGAHIDARQTSGRTLLHLACRNGYKKVAEFLIRKGAAVNLRDRGGMTPLFLAASNGHVGIVEILLANGADVNVGDNQGRTPLGVQSAWWSGKAGMVELLKKHGAKETLHGAVASGNIEEVKRLISQGLDINVKNDSGRTPLHFATYYHFAKKDVAELLIAKGADVNARENYGQTPLHQAAHSGRIDMVGLLLAHKANVDAKDIGGVTPLGLADENGHRETARLLRKHGARISVGVGETTLNQAVKAGDTMKVKSLIAGGADVNAKNNYGYSPLHLTCLFAGRKDQAELLIAAGADVNAKDRDGHSPLWHAQDRGHAELTELLRKHGAKE